MSSTPRTTGAQAAWWHRLHAGLMPDYNRAAASYWWAMVALGAALVLHSLLEVARMPPVVWLHTAIGLALAMLAGLFPVRVPGMRNSYVAGEIFIFLLLLVHGPAAAALAAAGDGFMGSYRSSKRWTSRLATPAIACIAMFGLGTLLTRVLAELGAQGAQGSAATLMAATMVFAAAYFLAVAVLLSGVPRLRRGERFFQTSDLVSVFRWVGMAYVGSASVAALLHVTQRAQGAAVLLVMLPVLVLLLVALHFYFRQQETTEALREAKSESDAREAATAAREADAAARHLHELTRSQQRFHAAFTHAWIGMAMMDFDGRILQANRALATLLGHDETALSDMNFVELVAGDDRAALYQKLGLAGGRDFEGFTQELRCNASDGATVWVALHCAFFTDPGSDKPCLILQVQDVSAQRRAEAGLQHLAFHDALTGLPNRRRFHECLAGALQRHQVDASRSFAVMFLDFDRFKLVNDSLGHNAGDALLIQVARRIQEKLRPADVVARLGGDEFAILVDHIEHERDAVVLAERLMDALAKPFMLGELEINTGASIGITFSSLGYASTEEMLRDADTAMYKAKNSGRSSGRAGYALFDASLHTTVSKRLRLEGELRHAVEQGQLVVQYQPLYALDDGQLTGLEALVRWHHPSEGTLAPLSFLPMAEESGLMQPLTDFVLHCACHQMRQWQSSDPAHAELMLSVNVSAQDIAQRSFVARVSRALVESGLRAEHLTLELTENILMSRLEGAMETLVELRRLGVRLAVDDFGTGYSSLAHLARLPIDCLKIDRSFVAQMRRNTDEAAVVRAIVQLGGTLRKLVVAEGVESVEQMEQLREMGCSQGQGFHWAVPLDAQAVSALLLAAPAGAAGTKPGAPLH